VTVAYNGDSLSNTVSDNTTERNWAFYQGTAKLSKQILLSVYRGCDNN